MVCTTLASHTTYISRTTKTLWSNLKKIHNFLLLSKRPGTCIPSHCIISFIHKINSQRFLFPPIFTPLTAFFTCAATLFHSTRRILGIARCSEYTAWELTYLSSLCSSHRDISRNPEVFKRGIETSFAHKLHQVFSAHSAEHCTSHFQWKISKWLFLTEQ